jgi:hypothetical protein
MAGFLISEDKPMKDKKNFAAGFKQFADAGKGAAVFATLNTIDQDGDVTLPGAFGKQTAKLSPAHDWTAPNIGKADISEVGVEAIADFQFYMDMESAKDWYLALKNNYENSIPQEFSYGFKILDSSYGEFEGKNVRFLKSLRVLEVSPVMLGAGVNTRLLAMKSADFDNMTLEEQFEQVDEALAASVDFLTREKALAALRAKEGRVLSARNREKLTSMAGRIREMMDEIDMLLRETEPKDPEKAAAIFAQYQRIRARLLGIN